MNLADGETGSIAHQAAWKSYHPPLWSHSSLLQHDSLSSYFCTDNFQTVWGRKCMGDSLTLIMWEIQKQLFTKSDCRCLSELFEISLKNLRKKKSSKDKHKQGVCTQLEQTWWIFKTNLRPTRQLIPIHIKLWGWKTENTVQLERSCDWNYLDQRTTTNHKNTSIQRQ